jgi:sugar transferase (PEP-CTERM/EpsH1 system associated)
MRNAILKLCRVLRPTVVHTRNLSGLDALLPARLAGVAHTLHGEHGWDVGDLTGNHWKPALLRRLHSPLVDRYITVSKHIERYLVTRVGISPARISQIYNGVDTERFFPSTLGQCGVVPPGFVKDGRLVIGTVGRIQAVKDHASLARAFAKLLHQRPDLSQRLRLVIVGDGPVLADLRALVEALGIEAQTWLPGSLGDIPNVMRAFDVFVLPSLAEGVSNTILEAMATGLPILASAVGGNVEIVEDEITGRLFKPRDVETLARLILDYVDSPQLRDKHARAGRRAAVARFDLNTMVDHYQEIYEALCYGRGACPA